MINEGDILCVKRSHLVAPVDQSRCGAYRIRIDEGEIVIFLRFRSRGEGDNWRDMGWNMRIISPSCGEVHAISEYMERVPA